MEMLRLQLELERYKKWYYGPRADRLASSGEVAQMLLAFAEEVDRKPVHPDDLPPAAEAADELRRVRRRKGRRNLANFENLPVTTHVHELSAEERACPCCGIPAPGDRRGGKLADRILSRPFRAHSARAQKVRLRWLRTQRRRRADRSGGQAGSADGQGAGRPGIAGLHRDE